MNVRLTQLVVKNFRGIRDQSIPLDGKNLLLIGENGSGKSSFVDAFEYLFTGRLERLKRRDVKEKQSIPFVKTEDDEVVVGLACLVDGHEMQLELGYPYKVPDVPETLQDWFNLACSRPFILRRAQILRFVEAKGADRYKQISTLIGLDEVDEIEKTWRDLKNGWKRREQEAALAERGAALELRRLVSTERAEEPLVIETVNQWLENAGAQPIATMQELPQRKATIQVSAKATEAAQKANRLLSLAATLKDIAEKTKELLRSYATFYGEWEEFVQAGETIKEALFRTFLEKGKELLEQHPDLEECPLCQAAISHDDLLKEVRQRLAELEAIRKKEEALKIQLGSLRDESATICSLVWKAKKDQEAKPVQGALNEVQSGLGKLREAFKQGVLGGEFPAPQSLQKDKWVKALPNLLEAAKHSEEQARALQPSQIEQQRMKLVMRLGQVEGAWRELEQSRNRLQHVRNIHGQVEKVYAALIKAREERLEEIHRKIEKLVNDYYQRLHPGEGYGDVQLPMESSGKGVGLRTCFYDVESTHPLGFYSEGHLDTLGLAIFLAFIKEFNGDLKLLVLDDVFTTVDRGHRQRVASLLCDEFADYQMILTTHDRFWAEELLTTMRSAHLESLALHLIPWNVERGVDLVEFLEERWDEYRERAQTHAQSAVADTGRDLEKFLHRMRYNLRLSVPTRPGDRYTIGDLYDPFFSWFKKRSVQHPSGSFDGDLGNLKAQLDVYWRQRNWAGAHYNEWGESLSSTEAIDFIDIVAKLVSLFRCPRCGSLILYEEKSGVLFCSRCKDKPDGTCWRVTKGKKK